MYKNVIMKNASERKWQEDQKGWKSHKILCMGSVSCLLLLSTWASIPTPGGRIPFTMKLEIRIITRKLPVS